MKIKSLKIHNIASIEDAEIDFCSEPLKSANLFLLTGTTGAGKTTILDSICLALYNTTPRLEKGEAEKLNANRDNLTGRDPRNLMRANTGEAYVNLSFTGNNGKEYQASWYVGRGERKRPESALSNVVWTISNLTDGEEITADKRSGYLQIRDIMHSAIGLDFGQFCRTSMLPQGEFTEFLKSDEDSKAEILEKISGCGLYSRIGQEIYAVSAKAEKEYRDELARHDEIAVLDEDKRKEIEDCIKKMKSDAGEEAMLIKDLGERMLWLDKMSKAEKMRGQNQAMLSLETEKSKSPEFLQKEKDVREWTETVDIRSVLKLRNDVEEDLDNARQKLEGYKSDWKVYLGYKAYVVDLIGRLVKKQEDLIHAIEAEADNQNAYNRIVDVAGLLTTLSDIADKIQKFRDKAAKERESLSEASQKAVASQNALAEVEKECDATAKKYSEAKKLFEDCNLRLLRNEKDKISVLKAVIDKVSEYRNELAENRKAVELKSLAFDALMETSNREKEKFTVLQREDSLRKETVDQMVTTLRAKLNEVLGSEESICPVCRQKVISLPSDALISEEYARFSASLKSQEEIYEKAVAHSNDAKVELDSLLQIQKSLYTKLDEAERSLSVALRQLPEGGMMVTGLSTINHENVSAEDLEVLLLKYEAKIKEAESFENRMNEIKLYLDGLNEEKFAKSKTASSDLAELDRIKTAIQINEEEVKENVRMMALKKAGLDSCLKGSEFANLLHGGKFSYLQMKELIEERQKTYRDYKENIEGVSDKINDYSLIVADIKVYENLISQMQPDWTSDEVIALKPDKNPGILWSELNVNVKSVTNLIKTLSDKHKGCQDTLNAYFSASPRMDENRLGELNKIDAETFFAMKRTVEDVNSNIADLNAAVKASIKAIEDLYNAKPERLKETDDIDLLEREKNDLERKRDNLLSNVGALEKELSIDDRNKLLKGDTSKLDRLKEEAQRWAELNREFGDKEGRKLRKIAQSYILEGLLTAANRHLMTMAPRYRLLVNSGTLNLKLEDRYNGYSTRSTNSISGGESFLVSLSLALALADFGSHLGVSTLFIDEGFGTLSGTHLQSAINTLQTLHSSSGRQVGIISHREEIKESIPVRIEVIQKPGSWASTVNIY